MFSDTVVRDAWYMEMCSIFKCDPKVFLKYYSIIKRNYLMNC